MSTADNQCRSVKEVRARIATERYIIEEFVGKGGMACVYKAREKGTPNVYALKLLKDQFREHEDFLRIFEREADHMRDLQYPNIVRFYKLVVEEENAYIIMEYVEGSPLSKYIQRAQKIDEPFPVSEVVRIMVQIARAINYIHEEGYIHYDVKPSNVLLRQTDGRAYLTDLGITNVFDSSEVLLGAGTPAYMPYEQQAGEQSDKTVDIYAFAVMLFEMLAGQKPFQARPGVDAYTARDQYMRMHESRPVPSLSKFRPELPPEIDDIFRKALAKKHYNRYQDVMEFVQDVHQTLIRLVDPDLRDFENIQPHQSYGSGRQFFADTTNTPLSIPPRARRRQGISIRGLVLVAAAVVVLIAALMIAAFGNFGTAAPTEPAGIAAETEDAEVAAIVDVTESATSTSTQTFTPSPTASDTPTATVTLTPTPTSSSTPTNTPTLTPTPTATHTATATPTATQTETPAPTEPPASRATITAALLDAPTQPLQFAEASPFGLDELDESAAINLPFLVQRGRGIVPLSTGDIDGFDLEMILPEGSQEQYTSYGLIFRLRDRENFLRFRILVEEAIWRFEAVENGEQTVIEEGDLIDGLPNALQVRGLGEDYVAQYDENLVGLQTTSSETGTLALWLEHDNAAQIELESLSIALLGESAVDANPTPIPFATQPLQLLLEDMQALRQAALASGEVNCPAFIAQIEVLALYDQWDETADYAQEASEVSAILASRCRSAGEETVDFRDRITDFLDWEAEIEALLDEIEAAINDA